MRMNNIINLSLAAVIVGFVAACTVSTDLDTTINREIENAVKLKEEAKARGEEKELLAFLHFPPIFKGYICDEIILELYRNGVERCYFGHIHGNYDCAKVISYSDITFYLISADYLLFEPLKIEPKS